MADKPIRIQRRRVKGWKMPPNAIAVSRPGYFGNPFSEPQAAMNYRRWLTGKMRRDEFDRKRTQFLVLWSDKANVLREFPRLSGKDLACWCKPGEPCHADVLLELANAEAVKPCRPSPDEVA
jgi:hypothetical protein